MAAMWYIAKRCYLNNLLVSDILYVAWINPAQKSLMHYSSFLVITLNGDVRNFCLRFCVAEKFYWAALEAYCGVPSG